MEEKSKYQWPANRIMPKEMKALHQLREEMGVAINEIVRRAIGWYYVSYKKGIRIDDGRDKKE